MGTRNAILDYLAIHPFASAEDFAQLLSKTRANIQYHLKQLERSSLICVVTPTTDTGDRGRPRRYYSLAMNERPHNLAQLAHAILMACAAGSLPPSELFTRIANEILFIPGTISASTTRLNRLVKELSLRGYQARWEAHSAGPEILFRNCPYASLLSVHPELCQIDIQILNGNLGTPFMQQSRIELPRFPACRFVKRL